MLTKIVTNFYFLLFFTAFLTGCDSKSSTDQIIIQTHEFEADALPSFMPIISERPYLIKSIKYASISLEAKEKTDQVLLFNGATFYDFQIWISEGDTIAKHLHYGNTVQNFPEDKTEGITIPLSFENGEKKIIYYSIHDLGYAFNDSFSVKSPEELQQLYVYEKYVKIICRSILGVFFFLGLFLGFYLRKKIFFYYILYAVTGLGFIEAEYGFILHLIPDSFNSKLVQTIIVQVHHQFTFFFFYSLIFNGKGIDRRFNKTMKAFLFICFLNCISYFIFPQDSPFINDFFILVGGASSMTFAYLSVSYMLYKGIQLKIPIAKPIIYIFALNLIIIMLFSGLANLGMMQKNETSRTIFYYLFTFDSFYYITVILYKYYSLIQERKALLMKYNELQREYSLALMEGQENEKNRIGRELHDHIGGNLAMIDKMGVVFKYNASDILADTISSLDDMIKGLAPKSSLKNNFKEELEKIFEQYKTTVVIHFTININSLNSPFIESQLYRITQELLANAVKHGQAQNIYFNFNYIPAQNIINLHYYNDGVGITKNTDSEGIGFRNMKYRVEKLKGKMEVEEVKEGCKINFINIPLDRSITQISPEK
ncbi:sensor histidine kinase [Flammeovirga aprica]|uniref:histidine kinase n=1 Tax=Flammeovirga aprica JL-4 TaxID=694437 RepID=A0A7X9P2L5_9BACT|nr:ATP-binding protein [Flammeovirga aprica]NME67837.1 hypothetical protein [Flammeovirga aprica JL-4]